MKIILVRHGESEANAKGKEQSHGCEWENTPLSKKGRSQAEHLARYLKKEKIKIDFIYTSNLKRAIETAEIISKTIKVPIKGGFEGFNEYESKILKNKIRTLFNRRLKELKKILRMIHKDRKKEKTVMIVAHGITNKIILGKLLELPLNSKLLRFNQDNTGTSSLVWKEEFKNWSLRNINVATHVPRRLR